MTEKKQLKKAYKKAKRKYVSLWKTLTVLSLVIAILAGILIPVFGMFDNALGVFVGGEFYEMVNEDKTAVYFPAEFESEEEMGGYGSDICQQVEAEGAVLLMNENNALPLEKGSSVSCFSTSSVNLVYGGTGSAAIDSSKAIRLKDALEHSGFKVNETLWDFYLNKELSEYQRPVASVLPITSEVCEAPWSLYTEEVLSSVSAYGDAAIVVLSRVGGEQEDLPYQTTNYLALDENERDMLEAISQMKHSGTVKKMIVLLNSSNAMELDFLADYPIDACLWIGGVGESGINAIADILCGEVNPSGSLPDTWCYDNFSAPAMWNFTPQTFDGYTDGVIPSTGETYLVYQEGIYVGYRYYETRYEDFVMGIGNAGSYDYASTVAYPFGYGMSYTTFAYSDYTARYDAATDQYAVTVTVTNTGNMAGKEAVQIYVQSPYTQYDIDNGVEKSSVALVGYGKTQILKPGASETLIIRVNRRDIASYDAYGMGTYILDTGDYYLTAATDAHHAVNNILAAKGYTTADGMTENGNPALTWMWTEEAFDPTTYAQSVNGTDIYNRLSASDPNLYEGSETDVTWLSRSDWMGTLPTEAARLALTEIMIADLQEGQYDPANYESMEMPTLGADNGLTLYDMMGKEFDDPEWDKLLDQLTFDEMVTMIGDAFHFRMPIESVNAPGARDENGPQGLTTSMLAYEATATAFTSADVMAATLNDALLYQVGRVIGNNCLMADVVSLYGPGANIHRTAYCGRNFEYYSEDGFLSGRMCAQEVRAIEELGVNVLIKHFALNDSETNRIGIGIWLNEQAAREIYLKAFQASFEEADANGVMIAYARWGTTWSGGNRGLMTGILREEWGNVGWSITDNIITTYIYGTDGVLAGATAFDAMLPAIVDDLSGYEDDAVIVNAMRNACHYNLYALANSSGMNGMGADTQVVAVEHFLIGAVRTVAIVFGLLSVFFLIFWVKGNKKLKATQEYQDYRNSRKKK